VLNLVAGEADTHRQALTALGREHPDRILREIQSFLREPETPLFASCGLANAPRADLRLPPRHSLSLQDLHPQSLKKVLVKTYERQAEQFEHLVGEAGIGPQALRSLSLIAELIYQAPASRRDPAAYSFAWRQGRTSLCGQPVPVRRQPGTPARDGQRGQDRTYR
jgi:hypothetical protein